MKNLSKCMPIVFFISVLTLTQVSGQEWSAEQLEVWKVIEAEWNAGIEQDTVLYDKVLHENFLGWNIQHPMPRDKSSFKKWNRFDSENSRLLIVELYPIGIVVQGNTAVAHYFYSNASENTKKERKTVHGRFTDILIKENGSWQFLSWSGGDNPTIDDE